MSSRNTLLLPVLFGVLAIVFTVVILVLWNVMLVSYYLVAQRSPVTEMGVGFWLTLAMGDLFLVAVGTVLVLFLIANIRQVMYARQQDGFLDSVTHELKSPLASLQLALETMRVRELPPEMQARFVAMMEADVGRLRSFIEEILEASRLEHDEHVLQPEPTRLSEVVAGCIERALIQHELTPEQLSLVSSLPADEPLLLDGPALETILRNLLDNAIKYSEPPAQVEVRLARTDGGVRIEVADQGAGIARRQLSKVFTRFYRIPRMRGRNIRGTGLGLYVVAQLVRRLGGRIWADSPGEDLGSVFSVELPAEPA